MGLSNVSMTPTVWSSAVQTSLTCSLHMFRNILPGDCHLSVYRGAREARYSRSSLVTKLLELYFNFTVNAIRDQITLMINLRVCYDNEG